MQLYSQAVEFYSGQNDEKYMYFTERIQNTLLRPEILKLMKEHNNVKTMNPEQRQEDQKQKKAQIEKEQKMSQAEKMKQRQLEHEQRKKARVDMMHQQEMHMGAQSTADIFLDAEAQKNREIIKQEKIKVEKTIQLIKNDQISQKNSIESRIAERKKRLEMKRSVILQHNNSIVETTKDPVKPTVNLKKKYRA